MREVLNLIVRKELNAHSWRFAARSILCGWRIASTALIMLMCVVTLIFASRLYNAEGDYSVEPISLGVVAFVVSLILLTVMRPSHFHNSLEK